MEERLSSYHLIGAPCTGNAQYLSYHVTCAHYTFKCTTHFLLSPCGCKSVLWAVL